MKKLIYGLIVSLSFFSLAFIGATIVYSSAHYAGNAMSGHNYFVSYETKKLKGSAKIFIARGSNPYEGAYKLLISEERDSGLIITCMAKLD